MQKDNFSSFPAANVIKNLFLFIHSSLYVNEFLLSLSYCKNHSIIGFTLIHNIT